MYCQGLEVCILYFMTPLFGKASFDAGTRFQSLYLACRGLPPASLLMLTPTRHLAVPAAPRNTRSAFLTVCPWHSALPGTTFLTCFHHLSLPVECKLPAGGGLSVHPVTSAPGAQWPPHPCLLSEHMNEWEEPV
uniref:Uncharacterized protein n=1 Tax=Molossus molossus TaxID=27622 RepID=A0A7J8BLE0_MOLMO|nr:hypothetical protein HJG59_010151 [Molossus molossus]